MLPRGRHWAQQVKSVNYIYTCCCRCCHRFGWLLCCVVPCSTLQLYISVVCDTHNQLAPRGRSGLIIAALEGSVTPPPLLSRQGLPRCDRERGTRFRVLSFCVPSFVFPLFVSLFCVPPFVFPLFVSLFCVPPFCDPFFWAPSFVLPLLCSLFSLPLFVFPFLFEH